MQKYFFHALFAIALLPCVQEAGAADEEIEMRQSAQVSQATVEQVQGFLERFIDPSKTPAEQAELFADKAEYYDQGVVSKAKIVQDVKRYSDRWPWRFFKLQKIDSIIPDPDSDRALVKYEINFEVAKPAKTIAGKAYYIAIIANLNGAPKVEKIEEIITRRKTFSTLQK